MAYTYIYIFYLFIYIYRYCSNFTLWLDFEMTAAAGFSCICYIKVLKMGDNAPELWFPMWGGVDHPWGWWDYFVEGTEGWDPPPTSVLFPYLQLK
jgi:hypothetical protein